MAFLTATDKQRIAQAIADVERQTRGELVTVIAPAAAEYLYIPLLWAAFLALSIPGVIMLSGSGLAALYVYEAQVVGFLLLALLFNLRPLKLWLIPKSVKHQRAHRLALEQFHAQNLHHTAGRTGVLIFVSVAERYVEIIADQGINDKVPAGAWDQVIADFTREVRTGRVADGFLGAIAACGRRLIEHFPAHAGDKNELPNHLVELE